MTRLMYDGVTPSRIPADATMVAGYVDGRYANLPALRQRFPHATVVEIAVFAHTNGGTVLDVEAGDATPGEAPGWVVSRRHAGVDPTVYCSASVWPAVQAAFRNAGIAEPHYWIARYDNDPTVPTGAVAKQYKTTAGYDVSSVAAYWPGVDPKPTPAPPEEDVLTAADKAWISLEIATQINAALPAIATAVADTDGLYQAPADRQDKTNTTWALKAMVQNIDEKVTALVAVKKETQP